MTPDWLRIKKALSVEADRGFGDLQGNQYRFSEFMTLTFGDPLKGVDDYQRRRWSKLAQDFAQYPNLTVKQRQGVVAIARRLVQELMLAAEASPTPPQPKRPKTTPLVEQATVKQATVGQAPSQQARAGQPQNTYQLPLLDRPLKALPKLSRKRSLDNLARLGIITVRDALFYYPRDHMDYARQVEIAHLTPGETVTVMGYIKSCSFFTSPKNKSLTIMDLRLRDRSGQLKLSRFFHGPRYSNRGWQKKQEQQYPRNSLVAASGLVKVNKYGTTLENPEIEVLDGPDGQIESLKVGRILPVYPLTEGVSADVVRGAVLAALPAATELDEPLPTNLRKTHALVSLAQAIQEIHYPPDHDRLIQARRRLVFDEFFYLQLSFLRRRQQQKQVQKQAAVLTPTGELSDRFRKLLPFALTNAQQRVISDIWQDLQASTPMNRLVQGDVGSGKTVVAVFAILAALQSGYQAALMAPTEVLAEQHYRKLVEWFNQLYLPVDLLTGSTKTKKRREIHDQLYTGELPLLVGTHALIEDPVQFRKLGLVVIDEQHRFGVKQRARLLAKGESPHVLTMTATPIPRTLSLTLHGDLDVSQIDELPPGRQPIQTQVLTAKKRQQAYDLIRRELASDRQAYIIFPMIEESEKLDVKAAVKEHERLQETIFPEVKVGLLHGRMTSAEKDEALRRFRDNETPIIVSTTVIEVGVDVPNATVMLIENAERFGLSQLHQLRGRVGRGSHQSHCLLMSSGKNPDSQERLEVLAQSQDGFFIAEMDLRLRGPGEVLGTRQAGLADFALASLVEDQDVLFIAREAAEQLLAAESDLASYPKLRAELEQRDRQWTGGAMLN
ncbi:MAG: ATP-dependent DNA helicase RecG [Spirulina sp. SIO3F2]|nr:ATP-dependent DNA helicase RecG [Spirulina sp. SIO3F2]